jgi:acetyl-CoA carboxylase carboxyltransferase component
MVAAMMGPCAAGTAYIPALSDFVPMVSGQGAMALAGPHLTKAVTGEDISMEELGGAKVHCRKSGVGDLEVKDDEECIARSSSTSPTSRQLRAEAAGRRDGDPDDRMSEKLLEIVPESSRQPYDMYDVIGEIVDDGEWFDIKPKFAKTLITCFARFGGQPVGIVANQPKQLAASSTTTPPTRRRASSTSATPSTSRSSSSRTCPASWSARRSSTPGSSATGRRCSTRSAAPPCRR